MLNGMLAALGAGDEPAPKKAKGESTGAYVQSNTAADG
jgi:hypothetical protein